MNQIIVFLLALLLPFYASAETLRDRLGAPNEIAETFQSNTGKIVIEVDAAVHVPDSDRIPTYAVTPRALTQDEARHMADACFGVIPYSFEWWEQQTEMGTFAYADANAEDDSSVFLTAISWQNSLGILQDVKATFENHSAHRGTEYPVDRYTNVYLGAQPAGCSLGRDEARRMADAAVSRVAPGMVCVEQAIIQGISTNGSGAYTEDFSGQEAWVLYYGKDLPLPVTYDVAFPNDLHNHVHHPERLTVVVDDAGVAVMEYHAPYTLDGILEESCELLSFDQIMAVASRLMPLKNAYLEQSYADVRIQITDIKLGYMYTLRLNAPNEYMLTPVWDFVGTAQYRLKKNGSITAENATPFQIYLTINAIDGTVIDRMYGY